MNFEEKCYRHFNAKYKDAVKKIDDKYANGYKNLFRLENEVVILKAEIEKLKREINGVKNERLSQE